jgi:hypothetical protein
VLELLGPPQIDIRRERRPLGRELLVQSLELV